MFFEEEKYQRIKYSTNIRVTGRIVYNPFNEYNREVVEFFNTITYLGGKHTACFIGGLMNLGEGRNSQMQLMEKKMSLGGSSETVCAKYQAGYTSEAGAMEEGSGDPELPFLSILPHCPHVGKGIKALFCNWWLKCRNEQISLVVIRTLRNRSVKTTKDKFRKLIRKNNHIKNKE